MISISESISSSSTYPFCSPTRVKRENRSRYQPYSGVRTRSGPLSSQPCHDRIEMWRIDLLKDIRSGDVNAVKMILRAASGTGRRNLLSLCTEYASDGTIPIDETVTQKRSEILRLMIEQGIPPDIVLDRRAGRRLLHEVVEKGTVVMLQILLENDVQVNSEDRNGMNPLAIAATHNKPDMILLLLQSGSSVNISTIEYFFDGTIKLDRSSIEILIKLIERAEFGGASLQNHFKPLHLAVTFIPGTFLLEVLELVLEHGCDINSTDKEGATVLHYLCGHSSREFTCMNMNVTARYEAVKMLLQRGANVDLTVTEDFNTALHIATRNGFVKLAELLVKHGADMEATNFRGHCPADLSPSSDTSIFSRVFKLAQSSVKRVLWFTNDLQGQELDKACMITQDLIGKEWKDLFRQLMISVNFARNEAIIQEIEASHVGSLHEQATQALLRWRKQRGPDATINTLKTALRKCELQNIIDSLPDSSLDPIAQSFSNQCSI